MKNLVFYRVITYILLPFGMLFGILSLFGVLIALSNPSMLLGIFLIICSVLYIFSSFSFLNKIIIRQQKAKKSFKDFIKVNALVTIIFAVLSISGAIAALSSHQTLSTIADEIYSMYKNSLSMTVNKDDLLKTIKGSYIFFTILFLLILLHSIITLRLIKKYAQSFV